MRYAKWGSLPLLLIVLWASFPGPLQAADPFAAGRTAMVQMLRRSGIRSGEVLRALAATPRHLFVSPEQQRHAYYDMALPIGHGQTISPPYIVAFMTEQLDPQPDDKVLEIGTGSGYQAAVLSHLVRDVYTIEIVEPLGQHAANVLQTIGYENVHTRIGDGFQGWPEHAPFDKIIVTCSPEKVPQPLVDQLADGGLLVIPVGERFQQTLCRFKKVDGKLEREPLQATFFVPMTGTAEERRQVKESELRPQLVHGGFEETFDGTQEPAGWYYVRRGTVTEDAQAPEGKRSLVFQNTLVGRDAQALQSFGVDGRQVQSLDVSLWARGRLLRRGRSPHHHPRVLIEFYDENRAPVGHETIDQWVGNFPWQQVQRTVPVPETARLAVIGIGLFGGTGELAFDNVQVASSAAGRE